MVALVNNVSFEYPLASISDLRVEATQDDFGRSLHDQGILGDESVGLSNRFWNSLYARFGFSGSFFKYFSHDEVFDRLVERSKDQRVRLSVERNQQTGTSRLLAVSNPSNPIVRHEQLLETLDRYESTDLTYSDGVIQSTHVPRVGQSRFDIAGDEFSNRFIMSCPVDGYGQPSIYLSLLRQICSNGMIGYAKAFRSKLSVGRGEDNVQFSIMRALDGFGNDEGYACLRQRFQAASESWCSVAEANSFYKLLLKSIAGHKLTLSKSEGAWSPFVQAFQEMTGDVSELYGIANVDALSAKRQRTLPVRCTVYDLLNFASEVASHHLSGQATRSMQAWIGTLISSEYDLEGSVDSFGDFQDFFVSRRINGEVALDLQGSA